MRENVIRDLASRAVEDPALLRETRRDLQGALDRHGYRLTNVETQIAEDLRRQTESA